MSTATANSAPVAVHTSGGDIGLKGRNGDGLVRYSFDLEVDYITERIIAVSFPAGGLEAQYRSNLRDVVAMLKTKHENNYIIFNLSRRRQDISKLNNQVYDLGWPNQLAPPLERLCSICKHIETWLKSDPQHVIVLHCKGGRGPIGTVISAFMNYINITASAETMLDRYAMKRFLDAKAIPIMHPSQHRYVGYFMGLLQGSININSAPLYLHNILIHGVPNFDSSGGCRPFVRIYQGMQPVYTSGVYSIPEGTSRFAVSLDQALPLRGDILVKCYHKKFRATTRDVIFRCQFHTTAVVEYRLEFKKHELDDASTDARFPEFTKVELIFSATPEKVHGSDYVPADSNFPVDNTDDPLIRWDSYENFNKVVEGEEDIPQLVPAQAPSPQSLDIPHSSAPDGSLYAQVKKSPSPETNPGQPLMTSTPARNAGPVANGPSQVNGPLANGPTRPMNHKEKTELDELLRGIGEDLSDSERRGSEEANRQHSSPRFVNPQVHVTTNGGTRTIPSFAPEPAGGTKPPSLTRQRRSDMENPYAEITDALVRKQEQQLAESARSPSRPVEEEFITSQVVKVEESSMPLFNGLDESNPSGKQGYNVPDRTPNGFVSHGTQYSPQVTPQTSHRTMEPRAHSMPNSPTRFAPQVNGGHQSPPPNVYQPQPVRAQKEQIRYITRVTPPGTPIAERSFEEQLPEQTLPETQPMQPFKRSTSPDDSMSWLQKQQQKLREKRAREGARRQPVGDLIRSGPWKEPSGETRANRLHETIREFNQAPKKEAQTYAQREPQNYAAREPHNYAAREPQTYAAREPQTYASREPQMYASREPQTYATREPQTFAPREPQPNGNMSWLEIQQQKLRERQEYGMQKPLYVDTSQHTTPSQMSPLRSDSGLSSPASQYKAPSEISPSTSASGSIRYGRPTSPVQQLDDLEKSISELESLRNLPHRSGAPTPPNTYVNYQQNTETSWQSHQRPLDRQTSDTSHNREQIPVYRRQPEEAQAPSYGANTAVTSLPPPSPRKDGPRPGSPGPLSASTPTTPTQGMDDVDLHIEEEPLNLEGLVKDRVANMTSKIVEHERSVSPPRGRSPRRSTGQSGYDSDTGVQQYYRPGRMRSPSPHDAWIRNPGGVPAQESEYWSRASGLKSPEMEREAQRQKEFEMGSSNESLHSLSSAASGARTPKFPMAPKLKSMVSTPITYVGKPPHGPDAPPALKSVKRDHHDILDGPFSDLDTQSDVLQQPGEPQRTITTTERTVRYTETTTERTERRQNQYPIEAKVETVPVLAENKEPIVPQYPIEAKVEVKPASYHQQPQQFKQTTIEAKLDTNRVTPTLHNSDVIQPQSSQRLETPPPKPPHTIQYGAAPQEFRGGVPARPTSPLAVAGNVPNQQAAIKPEQARVEEQTIAPQEQVMEEMVIPQSVRKEESAPVHLEFRMRALNESPAPGDTSPKRYAPQSPEKTTQPRSPEFVMPPMPNGTVKTPSPEHAPKQVVEETPIMVQKVKMEESAPVQFQSQLQQLEESTIVPQQVKVEESEPEQLQQQLGQLEQPPASSSDIPTPTSGSLTPSFTDPSSKPGGVQPPGVMYPTFSDRHRKAGPLRVDDSPNAGYKTMYDNKKQRSSSGSNEGVWPSPGSPHRGMPNGGITPTGSGRTTPSNFYHFQHHSPFGSNLSLVDPGVEKVRFVKDLSAWWYKPHATRDEAINMLRDKAPGSFVVRDSNSFPGAFGLAVKVAQLPPNAPPSKKGADPANELVRHFLIEPNARGVRLKGCVNEPIFGSLSALIYQHTLTQLALPCKLSLPDVDPAGSPDSPDGAMDSKSITALLTQGAACNVLYLYSFDMESLTGPNAVREAMDRLECIEKRPRAIVVHFKVALKGITLTDSHRKLFFRRHYPVESVLFCGMEPGSRRWPRVPSQEEPDAKIYGFVARKPGSLTDNMCHLFAEYEREQPASAIVSFVTKVLLGSARKTTPKTP